ncbi:unnamed protein product [Cercospora beticola]|nr:unnamed protein product [Cercospora beticola]
MLPDFGTSAKKAHNLQSCPAGSVVQSSCSCIGLAYQISRIQVYRGRSRISSFCADQAIAFRFQYVAQRAEKCKKYCAVTLALAAERLDRMSPAFKKDDNGSSVRRDVRRSSS